MANRRQLVKRRSTVRNIRKITRTMQLIATARFQQAFNRATATRPYAEKLAGMVEAVSRSSAHLDHPLLKKNEGNRSAMIVLTSNRGLCGGYNGNVLRTAMADIKERRAKGEIVDIHAVGKKAIAYFSFLGMEMASTNNKIDDRPRFEQVAAVADRMIEAYSSGDVAAVYVCYMRFISAGAQSPTIMRLMPISTDETGADQAAAARSRAEIDYDFSPEPKELLNELLPASVRMRLFQCFTDAAASEQVARMVAMKAATDAAGDMIKILTQQYNRARQTAITMELLDIIGGVAAIS
jgi:F-type H+-transporting ATPase subunit gamma